MTYTLTAEMRTTKGFKIRGTGKLPAVVYGAGGAAESLALSPSEFFKLYKLAGESSLIDLSVGGKETGKVLVQDVQFDPVSDQIIHVDLRRIDMNKTMTAPVTLRFVGESQIIKASGGTLVTAVSTVIVSCLPKDLVSQIDIQLGSLVSYDIVIKVKDIQVPAGITIVTPRADDLVVKAAPALTEEEIKAMEAASQTADITKIVSVADEKKAEKAAAEGTDGAAPAADAKKAEPAAKEEKKK